MERDISIDWSQVLKHNLSEMQGPTGTQNKIQEILRHLGTWKGTNLCLKCTKIRLAAGLCPGPLGWKVRRTMGKGFVEKMDGDSGDEGNDELTCVRSDKSDKSSWSAGRRSSLGSWDRVMRDGKSGCWPSERKRKQGGRERVMTDYYTCT